MLTLAMVRSHWRDLLASLLALVVGVGISTAALLVSAAARPQVPERFGAAQVLVRAPVAGEDAERFPEYLPWTGAAADAVAGRLRTLPGVAAAVPVRSFYAQLVLDGRPAGTADPVDPQGRAWSAASLAPYRLTAGRAPAGPDEVAVSSGYAVRAGDRAELLTATGRTPVTVTGTVDGPGVYLADDAAAGLATGVTLIGVVPAAGTGTAGLADAVAEELRGTAAGDATVLAGDRRAEAEPEGTTRTRYLGTQLLGMMLVLACFAAVFVVSQTFALAATHRRRDLALLRATGATPAQVRRMLLGEAAAIGLIGSGLGALAGTAAAPVLGRLLVRTGLEPVGFHVRVDPLVLAGVCLLGPLLAVAATWGTARRSGRVPALEAIRAAQDLDVRPGRLRLLAGAVAAAGSAAAAVAAAQAPARSISALATVSTLAALAAVTLLGPLVLPPLVRLLTWPLSRGRGSTGMLARGSMTTAVGRTTSTIAPVLATIAFATLVLGYVETGRDAYGSQGVPDGTTAVVAPDAAPGLPEDVVDRASALAGVPVDASLGTQVFTAGPGAGPGPRAVAASGTAAQAPGTASVNRVLADRDGLRAGATVQVVLPDGTRTSLQVAQVVDEGEKGRILLPRRTVRDHDASALAGALVLDGPAPQQLAGVTAPGVRVHSAAEYVRQADAEEYRLLRLFVLVGLGLALGYTLLSIANTLAMAIGGRARDLALLRLTGATPRQVLLTLACESLVTVCIGTVLGLAAGLAGVLGIRQGLSREVDHQVALALPWGLLAGLAAASAVLAALASLWPAWGLVRRPPSTASQRAGD